MIDKSKEEYDEYNTFLLVNIILGPGGSLLI